jgi:hypothetical protein
VLNGNPNAPIDSDSQAPGFDPNTIRRISSQASLQGIELVSTFYSKDDREPLPLGKEFTNSPKHSIGCSWRLDHESRVLGTLLRYEAFFGEGLAGGDPRVIVAEYRAVYQIGGDDLLGDPEVAVFAYWNGVYNTWPYWREFFSSMVNRGGLGRHLLPLFVTPQS